MCMILRLFHIYIYIYIHIYIIYFAYIRVRGIRTDYDIPGRDAEGAWMDTPGCSRRPQMDFWIKNL